MVNVQCHGCKAPYQIDEKRIPAAGLKMRCPQCATQLLVTRTVAPVGEAEPFEIGLPTISARAPVSSFVDKPREPPTFSNPGAGEDLGRGLDVEGDPSALPPPVAPVGVDEDISALADFGEIDPFGDDDNLPAVPVPVHGQILGAPVSELLTHSDEDGDLPAVLGFGDIDLPAALQPRARNRQTLNFGDIDLPTVPAILEMPASVLRDARALDLPATINRTDLPVPRVEAGLPAPRPTNDAAPFPAPPAVPARPAISPGPVPYKPPSVPVQVTPQGLPNTVGLAALPMTAQATGLPIPGSDAGLPVMGASGLPVPTDGVGLPSHAFPSRIAGGGLPTPAQSVGFPVPLPYDILPDSTFAEADLVDAVEEVQLQSPFDDSDRAIPMQGGSGSMAGEADRVTQLRAAVGDEADLGADPGASDIAARVPPRPRAVPPEVSRKRTHHRKMALTAAVVAAIGGGALALVPTIGPFGLNVITDQVRAKSNEAAFSNLKQTVSADLAEDTAATASEAIARCRAVQQSMKRYRPVTAYCAYVVTQREIRFGRRTEDEAVAKLLLDPIGVADDKPFLLATLARNVLNGQLGQARQGISVLAKESPLDENVAMLAADLEMSVKAYPAAVLAWKDALGVSRTARTLFGLARAQLASGDSRSAEASARAAIAASPRHAGARILLASLFFMDPTREEAEALTLLKQVTDPGDTNRAADSSEVVEASTLLGRIHLAKSRISAAEVAFAAALKIDPLATQALVGNGELFFRSGRYSEALARFDAATRADPEILAGKIGVAKTKLSLEQRKEAKDLLKKLRGAHPNDALVALWLGRADEALGNKKDAEAAYTSAIQLGGARTEVVDGYVALAHLLSSTGRTDDANSKLAEASAKFPGSAALHRARGEVALQMGRYEEARSEFEAGLQKEEDLGTRFRLGIALRRMRKYAESATLFDKVVSIDKDYPGLALERGLLFEDTGQSDKALEAYRDALRKAPGDVDLQLRVGSTLVMSGHGKEAEKILDEVRRARPNSAEVNHFLGRAILTKGGGNLAEAMRYLELAVNMDPNRAEYHLYVGWAANDIGAGAAAKATVALNKALELDHELGDAYWQRGVLLQREGATLDALRDLQTALEKRPSRVEAWAAIALCNQDLQKWPDAEQAWRKAIAGNDEVAEWHYRLGKLRAIHGNQALALPDLEKAALLADRPGQSAPAWNFDAHLLLADAFRAKNDRPKAILHYKRFLETAPTGNVYIQDAERALEALGAQKR